jgi:glycosyltransferase involved in cell wall biosynthesis
MIGTPYPLLGVGTTYPQKWVRLLAIGNDPTIALPPAEVMGDTHQRQLKYASILERYHLITKAPHPSTPARIQLAGNFWVYPCGPRGMLHYLISALRTGSRIAREDGIQVVSTQDPFLTGLVGYIIARRFGLPLSLQFVANAVDNPFWLQEKRIYGLLNRLAHWLIPRASTYRVNSEDERQKLIRLGVPPDRIWNLASITDFTRFLQADGAAVRQQYLGHRLPRQERGMEYRRRDYGDTFPAKSAGCSSDQRLVLLVARLAPQKDIPTLLQAFALVHQEHPQALLVVVGSGSLEGALRQQVGQMGLVDCVAFAGTVPYGQLAAYYAACDVFVLSSVYEGNARVLAEAAASARPVVSTAVSGASDTIVEGETGFIIPIGDHTALADRLGMLLSHPERAARMGESARQHILSLYDPDKLLAGFRDLWETTASIPANPAKNAGWSTEKVR